MQADKVQTKSVQILTAVFRPQTGPAGIAAVVANAPATAIGSIHEQAFGSAERLHFRAVLRALQLGRNLHARDISVLCPDEEVVKLINREAALEPGSSLTPLYVKVRALIYTYRLAEVRAVPRKRVVPAYRLAVAASRMSGWKKSPQKSLFTLAGV